MEETLASGPVTCFTRGGMRQNNELLSKQEVQQTVRGRVLSTKDPSGSVPSTWVAKAASLYIKNDPLFYARYFLKFEPKLVQI